MVEDDNFGNLLMDVALLRSLNIRVVLVHGAAAQVEALSQSRGFTASDLDGSGITDDATLDVAITASNRVTHELLEQLSIHDLKAAQTNAVIAHPTGILKGVDQIHTGKVEKIEKEFLMTLLDNGVIPVVAPLGFDGEGATYRVNSDSVASALASALGAAKLIYVTNQQGLLFGDEVIRQVQSADLQTQLVEQENQFDLRQVSKVRCALSACEAGVPRVHVISGGEQEGLLAEVFSNEGIGTLIYVNEYQQVRPATRKDIPSILGFASFSMENEEIVTRTYESIEDCIEDFFIYEIDSNPVACVALHKFENEHCGELACLCVSASHENRGIGSKLMKFIEQEAKRSGMETLLALSTQTFAFFKTKGGFQEADVDVLPSARQESYKSSGRNSRVLIKKLK